MSTAHAELTEALTEILTAPLSSLGAYTDRAEVLAEFVRAWEADAWHRAQETVRRELLSEVLEILTGLRDDREDVPEDASYSDGVRDTAARAMFEIRTRFPADVVPPARSAK